MSDYTKIIEESVKNLITAFSKLNGHDRKFAHNNLSKLIDHVNRTEKAIKNNVAKKNLIQPDKYDDTLDYLINVVGLLGFSELELNIYFTPHFINWFKEHALSTTRYQPQNVTTKILLSFAEAYRLFEVGNEREPGSYGELRDFLLNFDDVMTPLLEKQIKELTP